MVFCFLRVELANEVNWRLWIWTGESCSGENEKFLNLDRWSRPLSDLLYRISREFIDVVLKLKTWF